MRPESEQRDRVEKRRAYAEAGILGYLPIDCDTGEVVVHCAGLRHAGHRAAQGLGALTLMRPWSAPRAPVTGR